MSVRFHILFDLSENKLTSVADMFYLRWGGVWESLEMVA